MVSVGLWFVMMEAEKHQVSARSRSTHPLQQKTAGLMVSITRERVEYAACAYHVVAISRQHQAWTLEPSSACLLRQPRSGESLLLSTASMIRTSKLSELLQCERLYLRLLYLPPQHLSVEVDMGAPLLIQHNRPLNSSPHLNAGCNRCTSYSGADVAKSLGVWFVPVR